jgi:integrase/recombinase XerD
MTPEIEEFLTHLKLDRQVSKHTLSAYASDLDQFEKSVGKKLLSVKSPAIENYLKHLRAQELSDRSIARKITTLRRFYLFHLTQGSIETDPLQGIEAPVLPKKLPKALSGNVVEKILRVLDEGLPYETLPGFKKETEISGLDHAALLREALHARDRALVLFLYATGVRVTELITLKTKNLDLESQTARVTGKRSKERLVPFPPMVAHVLHHYIQNERPKFKPKGEEVFVGLRGEDLSRQAVFLVLQKIATQAGIKGNVSPHQFRHTFATELITHGMNLRSLQTLLGHADLQTTQIYTHVAPERLQNVIQKFHPRGGKRK